MASLTAALTLLPAMAYAGAVPPNPFQRTLTLQGNQGSFGFGVGLGEYAGNVMVGATESAYLFDVRTGAVVQEYLSAGGMFIGGGGIDAFGDKVAVGSSSVTGAVTIFDAASGQLLQTYAGSQTGDRFGTSVASNGDALFVGAPEYRQGTTYYGQGKVIALDHLGNSFTINNPEPGEPTVFDSESFGCDVEVIDSDLYVGALYDDDGGKVWHLSADTGATLREYSNPDGTLGNGNRPQFGISLDISAKHLLVGANQSSAAGVNASGAAYLFDRLTGDLLYRLFDPSPGVLENFGIEVALIGPYAIVGAHADGPGNAGSVFVFDVQSGDLVQTIQSPSSSPHFFGLRMSSVGPRHLAISEPTGNGLVHIYALVPEPGTMSLSFASALMFLLRRRRAIRR